MGKTPEFEGEPDEVLKNFPELDRARNLFLQLFQNTVPLSKLDYTARQIDFTVPVLRLLEGEGEVVTYLSRPFLSFENPNDPWLEALEVYYLPGGEGFHLHAFRDESMRGWGELTLKERTIKILMGLLNRQSNPVVIFSDFPGEVALIALFEEDAEINNLDYLIPQLLNSHYTGSRFGMKREGVLTKAAKAVGLAGVYRAAWKDERTKREFVAELRAPEDWRSEPDHVAFRRLPSLEDQEGHLITPIGKKAGISKNKVMEILEGGKREVFVGQLAPRRAEI